MNDEDLVKAAQKGDAEAFYKLILSCKDKLYNIAFCYLKTEQDTLESIQEVTYRAYLKINKLKEPKYFMTWITKILINYCIDEQKRKTKIVNIEEHQITNTKDDDAVDTNTLEYKLTLEDAIDKLSPKYKQVIILKYIHDMTTIDISRVMACPEGTIKTWVSRGLKQLKELLNIGGDFNV
jgi:RNA polymerase sigma-70 factor (ECF subfamily)